MKKMLSFILTLCLFCSVLSYNCNGEAFDNRNDLSDPRLLKYIEDEIYAQAEANLGSEDYIIEVRAEYESKEAFLEGLSNSRETNYFGYLLSDLDVQFQGTPYTFTLGEDGQTKVVEFVADDGAWEKALRDIAIGGGVILICVIVSVASGGAGAPAIGAVFAASAKSAATMAISSGVLGGVSAGLVKYMETGDSEDAIKAAVVAGSEKFKWKAIIGVVKGGAK